MKEFTGPVMPDAPAGKRQLAIGFIAGIAIGTSLMYLLDPRTGNRRRAIVRDKAVHVAKRSTGLAGKSYRHLRNKIEGAIAIVANTLQPQGGVSDRKLLERIRSTVGRTVPRPGAVDFAVHEGRVTVRGYLRPHEAGQVIQAVEAVPGVSGVENQIVDAAAAEQPLQ